MKKAQITHAFLKTDMPGYAFFTVCLLGLSATLLLNGCAERSAVDANSREIALTEGEGFHYGPCFSPDGKLIAYSSSPEKTETSVYVISASGGESRKISTGTATENVFAWTPEGDLVLLHRDGSGYNKMEVCWVTLDGEVKRSYPAKDRAMFEAISPDGQTIAFTSDRSGQENARR